VEYRSEIDSGGVALNTAQEDKSMEVVAVRRAKRMGINPIDQTI